MHAKKVARVRPYLGRLEICLAREVLKFGNIVFVGIFGLNGFAFAEMDFFASDANGLFLSADDVHFYAPFYLVVERMMRKSVDIEVAA